MYVADSGVIVMGRAGSLPMSPSLIANVALRLVLCPVAILITWVPLRLLWRHGEFPACVYVLNVWLEIFFVFINAAIWHNQTFDSWWLGYGWCDVVTYLQVPMITAYSASVCAIMQRLSSQVGLTRVSGLSAREKRHRVITQSVAIFSVPLLQVALTIFVQARRYSLAPGVGCTTQFYPTAVFLVFFHLPPLLFTLMACYHTGTCFPSSVSCSAYVVNPSSPNVPQVPRRGHELPQGTRRHQHGSLCSAAARAPQAVPHGALHSRPLHAH